MILSRLIKVFGGIGRYWCECIEHCVVAFCNGKLLNLGNDGVYFVICILVSPAI